MVRESGPTRFATASAIARTLGSPSTVLEADGTTFQDALVAGPAAAKLGGAVLLTNGEKMPTSTSAYLHLHEGRHYAVGSAAQGADPNAQAVGSSDDYDTAVAVAQKFSPGAALAGFASETDYADELSGDANVAAGGGPMILVPSSGALPAPVSAYLLSSSVVSGLVYGGTAAVSSEVVGRLGAVGR
ncbi:MAG: cell wall-binding repeat-containing protein [Acidimicrobiales bacterium]